MNRHQKEAQRIKLNDLCHLVTKGTTPTSVGLKFSDSGIPFLRIQNLSNKTISLKNVLFIDEKTHNSLKRSIIKPRDFLITIAGTIGKVAIVPDEFPECNCNQAIAILRFDYAKLHPEYLFHWLHTQDALQQITGKKVTATISNLSLGQIKNLEIPLPPLAEQMQIAAILDAADKLRQKDQQLVEHYNALSQSLFLEMFGDLINNPMSWDSVKLGDICGVGSSKRVFVSEFVDSGIPFYRGTEVGQLAYGNEIKPHLFISPDKYELLKNESGVPNIGDLLLPSICHDGRILKVKTIDPFYFKDGRVLWIKVNSDLINSDYLRFFLKGLFLTNYSNYASGTTFAELKIVSLKSIRVFNPPIEIQNQFAERVEMIEQQKQQAQKNLEKSEILFNSLLQRAFTGELTANKAA